MAVTTINTKQIRNATILDEDVDAAAAIAGTKISPNFGVQNTIVDTNVLFVNASTDRVGVGTASPSRKLDVAGSIALTSTAEVFAANPGYPVIYNDSSNGLRLQGFAGSVAQFNIVNASGSTFLMDWLNSGILNLVPQDATVVIGTTSATLTLGGAPTANGIARFKLVGSNTQRNWQVGTNEFLSGAIEFTPSTAGGGNTYTTPAMLIGPTGLVGVGTSSPGAKLHVAPASDVNWRFTHDGSGAGRLNMRNDVDSSYVPLDIRAGVITLNAAGSGNVGINVTAPSYKLDVSGTIQAKEWANADYAFRADYAVTTGNIKWHLFRANNTDSAAIVVNVASAASNDIYFQSSNSVGGAGSDLTIYRDGNIGIGTIAPTYKLDIVSTINAVRVTSSVTTAPSRIVAANGTGSAGYGVCGSLSNSIFSGNSAYATTIGSATAHPLEFATNNTVQAVISSAGNLGVGTASPSTDSRAAGSVTTAASIFLGALAGNPSTPVEGQIWYNSTTRQFMGRNNAASIILG